MLSRILELSRNKPEHYQLLISDPDEIEFVRGCDRFEVTEETPEGFVYIELLVGGTMTKRDDIRAWLKKRDCHRTIVYNSLRHKIVKTGFDKVYVFFEDERSNYWQVDGWNGEGSVTPTSEVFVSSDLLVELDSESSQAMSDYISVLNECPADVQTILHCIELDRYEGRS